MNNTKKTIKETTKKQKTTVHAFRGNRFALTIHGATDDQLNNLKNFFQDKSNDVEVVFGVAARETGEHSVHPHFQVYFETNKRTKIKNRLQTLFGSNFHVELARGTRDANVRYVYAVDKAYEIGWIVLKKGDVEVPRGYNSRAMNLTKNFKPRPFQKDIIDLIDQKEPGRLIHWFYEERGNTGKTFLGQILHRLRGAIMVGGRASDILHALARVREIVGQDPPIVVIDMSRAQSFPPGLATTIENVSDGLFFSGKYESTMIDMKLPPHVFVFANYEPDISLLSVDRWRIHQIDPTTFTTRSINASKLLEEQKARQEHKEV